ncbi:MAG: lipocalin family protein [Mycobacterium sp.]
MAERRALWCAGVIFVGLGAAAFTGAGIAAADADGSHSADSNSRSANDDSSGNAGESGVHRTSAAEDADASTDSSVTDLSGAQSPDADVSGSRNSRVNPNTVITLHRQVAADDDAAVAESAAEDDAAAEDSAAADENAAPDEAVTADENVAADEGAATVEMTGAASDRGDSSAVSSVSDVAEPETTAASPAVAVTPVAAEGSNVLSAPGSAPHPETVTAPSAPAQEATVSSARETTVSAQSGAAPAGSATVTGVQTGRAKLTIPVGSSGHVTSADWYFPTEAEGSVDATGVIWLQHGFLGDKSFYSTLAKTLSGQTNSIVVAPNVASFPLACAGCWLNGEPMRQAVATMFLGDREALNSSAAAAGYLGVLPEEFVLSGHSAGGGFAAAAGGYYAVDPDNDDSLRGVVMFDGFAFSGTVPDAIARLDTLDIPVYQVAAPPQLWNFFGATTKELVAARPDQFVGATLAGGSHVDSLLGGNPIVDFFAQLVTQFSPSGNTEAVHTLATGWINDLYRGLGPTDGDGIYGAPGQYIVMGDTAAVVLGPPPVVDLNDYLGSWYEVGSVKQLFSIGLVNTKAVYSLNSDESIKVENSGNYFFNGGPRSTIVGSALPVDPDNNKLTVSFFGPPSADPPGNYWIVDLAADYSGPDGWAVVSDPTGSTGFLLSRSPVVSADLYRELLDRASIKGVRGRITPTRQPGAPTGVATRLRDSVGKPATSVPAISA